MTAQTRHCRWCGGQVPLDAGPCPLSFACPTCQAEPGQWCKRPSERKAAELHAARRDLEFIDEETSGSIRPPGEEGALQLQLGLSLG